LAFQSKGSIIAFLSDSLTVVRGLEAPDFPFPIVDKGQLRGVLSSQEIPRPWYRMRGGFRWAIDTGKGMWQAWLQMMTMVQRRQGFRINGTGSLYFQIKFESCQFVHHLLKGSYASACSARFHTLRALNEARGTMLMLGIPTLASKSTVPR
jgi:hypothetical protein